VSELYKRVVELVFEERERRVRRIRLEYLEYVRNLYEIGMAMHAGPCLAHKKWVGLARVWPAKCGLG